MRSITGRASAAMVEGQRPLEERQAALQALQATLEASIAAGGHIDDSELDVALAEEADELRRRGIGE